MGEIAITGKGMGSLNLHSHNTKVLSFSNFGDRIEVIYREPNNMVLCSDPPQPAPDRIWKEIYKVGDDGKIFLSETINGRHVPAPPMVERIEFPNDGNT